MDVPKDPSAVADVATDHDAEVVSLGTLGPRQAAMAHLIRTLPSKAPPLVVVSEAGPCGDWLSRSLTHTGPSCWVVAPSRLPTQAGDRLNTDRRDAVPRARLLRSGARTRVDVPTVDEEAIRDLARAPAEARHELQTATFRLNAVRLRHDIRSTGRATWSPAPVRGLAAVVGATPAHQLVFQADVRTVPEHPERRPRLAQALPEQVHAWRLPPGGEALEGLRGVQGTVAVTLGADLGDLMRLAPPRHVMP
jgi:transposase